MKITNNSSKGSSNSSSGDEVSSFTDSFDSLKIYNKEGGKNKGF